MAISAIAGLATAIGAAALPGALAFFGATGLTAFAGYFAVGAGLSMVSRALAPKPNIGAQMRGITQTSREPASSRKIIYGRMRVGGQVVFISHSGDDNKFLNMAIVFATHEIQAYDEIWFNDNKIWTASGGFEDDWGTYVTIDRKFGTSGQAASTQLTGANVLWTANHKLSGIAYIAFKLEWSPDKFPQGVPNITAVIRGKKVYDPRDQSIGYSQNPALCLRDYMLDQSYGLGEVAANINNQSVIDAANLCDEQVTLDAGGTQDRYQCNGVIDTANQIKANIEQLLASMGGRLTYSGGEYFVDGAEYKTPTLTFAEGDIVSDIQTQTKQSRRGIYNGVKGIFVSEEKNFKVLDYPAQISSTYETEDGDPIYLDMALPCVTNNTQAQRLAKIALLKSRQQVVMTMTTNLKGLRVKVGDTIQVTNDRLNYSSKVFEVIDYSLAITDGALGVNLSCIETASAIYDWTTSDEEDFLSGGELDLYDGRTVANVTSLTHSVTGLKGPDGKNITTVDFTWTAPTDAFVEFYVITLEKDDDGNIFEYQTREPRLRVPGLTIGSAYEVIVKAQNLIGVRSSGTTLNIASLAGDTTPPAKPTNFTATGGVRQITVKWDDPTDEDFALTRIFINDSDSIPSTSSKTRGSEFVYTLADNENGAVTKYFWLKSEDYSGNVSNSTVSFTGTSKLAASNDVDIDSDDVGLGNVDNRNPQDQVQTGIEAGATVTAGGITLSAGGAIKGGQTAFNTGTGFFLGYESAAYKFSIGSSSNYFTWDGSTLTVKGSLVVGSTTLSESNTLNSNQSASDITTGTLSADRIQADSITVDKLSGDVSESFAFGLYNALATSLSTSKTTFGEFTTPAPDANIKKAAVLHAAFGINASSPSGDFTVGVTVERKSKGVTSGTALGTVVGNGSVAFGARYIEIAGNLLTQIDMYGGIATSQTSPSSIYNVVSIEYQSSTSRTRIIYASNDAISSGTVYYNADKWTSAGTYLTYSPLSVPRYGIIGVTALTNHILFQPLASSDAEETYRIRAQTFGLTSGSASMTVGIAGQIHLLR